MAKVLIHREGGQTIEISDLTFEQVKELAGLNGPAPIAPAPPQSIRVDKPEPDWAGFTAKLSIRGKSFLGALANHPQGIDAYALAPLLGLNDPRQIGGYTGGGLAKIAKQFNIKMRDIYTSSVTFPDKKRTRMFYPGKLLKRRPLQMEKPAV